MNLNIRNRQDNRLEIRQKSLPQNLHLPLQKRYLPYQREIIREY